MNLKDNLLKRFKQVFNSIGAIITTVLVYQPIYNYLEGIFNKSSRLPSVLTATIVTVIYTIFLAIIVDPMAYVFNNKTIVSNQITWAGDNLNNNVLDYLVAADDFENSICSVTTRIECKPKRIWLFSLMRFIGFGILIYGSGDNFGFTKSNSKDSGRYRVINNKEVFIKSFYNASNAEAGNKWDVAFGVKLLDSSSIQSHIYVALGFGTKKHKIKYKGRLMDIKGDTLTINIKEE